MGVSHNWSNRRVASQGCSALATLFLCKKFGKPLPGLCPALASPNSRGLRESSEWAQQGSEANSSNQRSLSRATFFNVLVFILAEETLLPTSFFARAAAVAGVLLHSRGWDPQLQQDGGKPHLCAGGLG